MLKNLDAKVLLSIFDGGQFFNVSGQKSFNRIWSRCIEVNNAIDPFLTRAPIEILADERFESHIDTLFTISPVEDVLTYEKVTTEFLKKFENIFEFDLPLEFAHVDFSSKVGNITNLVKII